MDRNGKMLAIGISSSARTPFFAAIANKHKNDETRWDGRAKKWNGRSSRGGRRSDCVTTRKTSDVAWLRVRPPTNV